MNDALRVRLEGACETLLSTTQTFERAARSLSRGQTDDVARAVALRDAEETRRARDAVERLAGEEPELNTLLERYRSARGAFVEALQSRAHELGLEGPANRELVEALERDVLWEGRAVNWPATALFACIGVFIGFASLFRHPEFWFLGPVCAFAVVLANVFTAPKLRVTRKTVVVGNQSFRLDEVRGCRVVRVEHRTSKGHRTDTFIEFELEQQRVERIKVPFVPDGFSAAMTALGLPLLSA